MKNLEKSLKQIEEYPIPGPEELEEIRELTSIIEPELSKGVFEIIKRNYPDYFKAKYKVLYILDNPYQISFSSTGGGTETVLTTEQWKEVDSIPYGDMERIREKIINLLNK